MTQPSLLQGRYLDPQARRIFEQERLVLEVADQILQAMVTTGTTRADLAARLGTSRSHVTQLLSGSRNMTLRTLADIAWALDMRTGIAFENLESLDYAPSNVPDPQVRRRANISGLFRSDADDGFRVRTGEFPVNQDTAIAA